MGSIAQASGLLPAFSFKTVDCVLKKEDVVVLEFAQPLMMLQIDEGFGRFAQVRLNDGGTEVQYQVLIEDDLKVQGAVVVLQNLMVGQAESSSEFSAKEPTWLRIRQQDYAVECALKKTLTIVVPMAAVPEKVDGDSKPDVKSEVVP